MKRLLARALIAVPVLGFLALTIYTNALTTQRGLWNDRAVPAWPGGAAILCDVLAFVVVYGAFLLWGFASGSFSRAAHWVWRNAR